MQLNRLSGEGRTGPRWEHCPADGALLGVEGWGLPGFSEITPWGPHLGAVTEAKCGPRLTPKTEFLVSGAHDPQRKKKSVGREYLENVTIKMDFQPGRQVVHGGSPLSTRALPGAFAGGPQLPPSTALGYPSFLPSFHFIEIYNSLAKKFTHFKYIIQWFLVFYS